MEVTLDVGGAQLSGHMARPPSTSRPGGLPGLVLCHGFPDRFQGADTFAQTYPSLAERIASAAGFAVLTFTFRGTGNSTGDFSLDGWLDDLRAAVAFVRASTDIRDIWLAGSGTGGALSVCIGGEDKSIRGVATFGAPSAFDDWADHPRRLLTHARQIGVIRNPAFPSDLDHWSRAFSRIRPLERVVDLAPRPLLVVHGADDDAVPPADARELAGAHGSAELHLVAGAGHRLRLDPRAIALLLGWLERQAGSAV